MQSIVMQLSRLEDVIDDVFTGSQSKLGAGNPTTKQALKALLYLQGLKYDIHKAVKTQETNMKVTNNREMSGIGGGSSNGSTETI